MFDAILFDLDGTLVENDMHQFVTAYFQTLKPRLEQHCTANDIIKIVLQANQSMLNARRSQVPLLDLFLHDFSRLTGLEKDFVKKIFDDYYENEYKKMQVVKPVQFAFECIAAAAQITEKIVIATLPIFPLQAIQQRLEWGNIAGFNYKLVTACEIMHTSKPKVEYFLEIAEIIECDPKRCLMIGNDYIDDMAARECGMTTYLLNTFPVNRDKGKYIPHYSGDMRELIQFLQQKGN